MPNKTYYRRSIKRHPQNDCQPTAGDDGNDFESPPIITNIHAPLPLVEALVGHAREMNWHMMDVSLTNDFPQDAPPVGAILRCSTDDPLMLLMEATGYPVVRLEASIVETHSPVTTVCPDLKAVGRLAVEHFVELGFEDVAYVGHTPWGAASVLYDGAEAAADEWGLNMHLLQLETVGCSSTGEPRGGGPGPGSLINGWCGRNTQVIDWMRSLPKPIGIIAYNPKMAHRLSFLCQQVGLRIPKDAAIISIDSQASIAALTPMPITYVDVNYEEQAREALAQLKRMTAGDHRHNAPILIQPKGVVKMQSTDSLGVKEPRVVKAIRFMWDNLTLPLTVEDVAREIGVPRSTLERLFIKSLGRSPNAELRRRRLELSCDLLRRTEHTIDEISRSVGFRSPSYLYQIFRKEMNLTPKEYRKAHGAS